MEGIRYYWIRVGMPERILKVTAHKEYHVPSYCEVTVDMNCDAGGELAGISEILL